LQQVKNFKYLGCEISCENENETQHKLANFVPVLKILNDTFKPTFFHTFSRTQVNNALAVPIFYMEAKFRPLQKRIKNDWYQSR
jgi:hypothetical protein